MTSFIVIERLAAVVFKNTHNFALRMLSFPNCKINLGLYITRKRDDGYHDLETVFYPVGKPVKSVSSDGGIPLHDVLEIVESTGTTLHMSGRVVTGNEADNLVWKAWQMLKHEYPDNIPPLDIYLHKVIPMGAGLGGGSADGAFMLSLLNDCFNLGLDKLRLAQYALRLGSDCPFFIYNTPQFASGRGEQMSALPVDLSAYSIQVICPKVHVSTAKAFSMITPRPAPYDLRNLHQLPLEKWRDHISNDFEAPVFSQHPELGEVKQQLYDQGAIYASMSGSGSAVYGIFPFGKMAEIRVGVEFEEHWG
jgi:4-diphosphocytidyl-2-C-methyl-D-erythritol kinase